MAKFRAYTAQEPLHEAAIGPGAIPQIFGATGKRNDVLSRGWSRWGDAELPRFYIAAARRTSTARKAETPPPRATKGPFAPKRRRPPAGGAKGAGSCSRPPPWPSASIRRATVPLRAGPGRLGVSGSNRPDRMPSPRVAGVLWALRRPQGEAALRTYGKKPPVRPPRRHMPDSAWQYPFLPGMLEKLAAL